MERIFDEDDVAKKPKIAANNEEVEDCDLGTQHDPKMVKLSATLSIDDRGKYVQLLKEFRDVFAWRYEDLKEYDTSIIQHVIPIHKNEKPFRQKLRRINPRLLLLIEKEVRRLCDAKIIVPLRFSNWLDNIVPARKKSEEIRLCIDFRNLNKVSLKDNYLLPKMDHVLHKVVGAERLLMLDGFSGYNQVVVHCDDQDKTSFTTPWGTFKYVKMPFRLMNAGAIF